MGIILPNRSSVAARLRRNRVVAIITQKKMRARAFSGSMPIRNNTNIAPNIIREAINANKFFCMTICFEGSIIVIITQYYWIVNGKIF
jgi:hypothetical protein